MLLLKWRPRSWGNLVHYRRAEQAPQPAALYQLRRFWGSLRRVGGLLLTLLSTAAAINGFLPEPLVVSPTWLVVPKGLASFVATALAGIFGVLTVRMSVKHYRRL